MPLALVAVVAYLVVDALHGEPVYTAMFNAFIGNNPQPARHKEDVTMSITIYAGARLDGCKIKDFPWPIDCIVTLLSGRTTKTFLSTGRFFRLLPKLPKKSTARFACSSQETDRSSRWEWATAARYRLKIFR